MSYAGDLTPQQAWDLLETTPDAVLVDVRTVGEWQQIGVPDLSPLDGDREVVFTEWATAFGPNPRFLDQLAEAGLTPGDGRPVIFLCRSGNRSIGAAVDAVQLVDQALSGIVASGREAADISRQIARAAEHHLHRWGVNEDVDHP